MQFLVHISYVLVPYQEELMAHHPPPPPHSSSRMSSYVRSNWWGCDLVVVDGAYVARPECGRSADEFSRLHS